MTRVAIDRARRLREEPHTGHTRWHPGVPAIIERTCAADGLGHRVAGRPVGRRVP